MMAVSFGVAVAFTAASSLGKLVACQPWAPMILPSALRTTTRALGRRPPTITPATNALAFTSRDTAE